jgi:hypothetical protein
VLNSILEYLNDLSLLKYVNDLGKFSAKFFYFESPEKTSPTRRGVAKNMRLRMRGLGGARSIWERELSEE